MQFKVYEIFFGSCYRIFVHRMLGSSSKVDSREIKRGVYAIIIIHKELFQSTHAVEPSRISVPLISKQFFKNTSTQDFSKYLSRLSSEILQNRIVEHMFII